MILFIKPCQISPTQSSTQLISVFKALNGKDWPLYLQVEVRALKQNLRSLNELNTQAPSKTVPCDVSTLTYPRPSKLARKVPPFAQEKQRKSLQMPLGPSGYFRVIPRVLLPIDTLII